ncbi:MAG: SDR family NAD(P)-dependent oxidoreductase [Ilumatobacteraceae bacterium]
MASDFMRDVFEKYLAESGGDPARWWNERVPVEQIDRRLSDLLDLRGKTAVVTGGAGLNLGQACVNRLAGLGAEVAVVDMTPEDAAASGHQRWPSPPDAEATAAAASEKWGTRAIAVHGDVMTWDGVQAVMTECADHLGRIDILVNNAADVAVGDFASFTAADIDRSIRGTLAGPMYCTRAVLDHMIPNGGGVIVNIGSEAANTWMPGIALYGSLKAGLAAFNKYVGKELAQHNVRLVGVNAGSMWGPNRTPLPDTFVGVYSRARTAIQRYELPEEVANMVAFLASDAASAMVGETIDMGGGMAI